jgi:hypothetical protein
MSHDGNSIGKGNLYPCINGYKYPCIKDNLYMEIPWTGPNFKWKFHGEGLI